MPYTFGKDITYEFYAVADESYQTLPTAPEAIYVYKEGYKPTRAQALAGTNNGGLVGVAITTWASTTPAGGKQFTIPAIDDPNPDSSTESYTYWVAVNFKFSALEQTQTVIRALPLQRVTGMHKQIGCTQADLETIFADIDSFRSTTVQDAAITLAETRIKQDLEAQGFEWALLWRPDELKTAAAYRALASLMLQLVVSEDDEWKARHDEYKQAYKDRIDSIRIEYDADNSGEPDRVESNFAYVRQVR